MEVQVRSAQGKLIWARNAVGGVTSAAYGLDSTLKEIKVALETALEQCDGELALFEDVERSESQVSQLALIKAKTRVLEEKVSLMNGPT